MSKKTKSNSMWGGRFKASPSEVMQKLNASIAFDRKLYQEDIAGSRAHAAMLTEAGILTRKDADAIAKGLSIIEEEIAEGEFEFREDLEDIHMNIEARLKELIGDAASRLHTARSRNDQVATDFRLYVRNQFDALEALLQKLQIALLDQAEAHYATIMPGFTHLQTAQPVTFGHHLLAYVEMFGRDRSRLKDARERMNESPLGAGALAGTSFTIDRALTAEKLGFKKPMENSLDAVSDRDFALEFLFAASVISVHLSRLGEEFILWTSAPFHFVSLPEAYTTGSSMMPQKRNPDAAELARGKTGRIFGALLNLLTVMKGLPLAYSKDMQEDKEPVFDTAENLTLLLHAMVGMVSGLIVNKKAMHEAARGGFSTATDLADWLVQRLRIPFREAHHITGRIVQLAEKKECELADLFLEDMQAIEPRISDEVFEVLSVENSVRSRTSHGGTAPENVKKSIAKARRHYA